jgi:hypothetical protein
MQQANEDRDKVRQVARTFLTGRAGVIETARALVPLLRGAPDMASKDDFNFILGIDSETDDLPLGPVRDLWRSEALLEKDREIARCDGLWRDQLHTACERILLGSQHLQ